MRKDKKAKSTGSKFREYFMLHLKCVRTEILASIFMGLFAGWIWGGLNRDRCLILAIIIGGWSIRAFSRTCSKMLYQQEAYLYQSFPVSAAETVFAKVITGAFVPMAGLIPLAIQMYGLTGVAALPLIIAGSLLLGTIVLAAISFGNSLRDSRAKKPSTIGTFMAAAVMLAVQVGLTAVFAKHAPIGFGLKILIMTVVFTAEAAGLLWYNTRSLGNGYQV